MFSLFGGKPGAAPGADVDPSAARALMAGGAPVIDVREPAEFAAGAIKGSVNVPLGEVLAAGMAALERAGVHAGEHEIVLVCRSGNRSGQACRALAGQLGAKAHNLAGGVIAWHAAGLPLLPSGRP
jgi:rhodanese-related sulfurtransferase